MYVCTYTYVFVIFLSYGTVDVMIDQSSQFITNNFSFAALCRRPSSGLMQSTKHCANNRWRQHATARGARCEYASCFDSLRFAIFVITDLVERNFINFLKIAEESKLREELKKIEDLKKQVSFIINAYVRTYINFYGFISYRTIFIENCKANLVTQLFPQLRISDGDDLRKKSRNPASTATSEVW